MAETSLWVCLIIYESDVISTKKTISMKNNKTYKITIAGKERMLPLCPINEELFIGAFVMFGDVELTVSAAAALVELAPEHEIILTPESKSIPLAYEMAKIQNKEYVVARKGSKLYMSDVVSASVNSITTASKQTLCLGAEEIEKLKGKRVVLVDDVISTGESIAVLMALAEKAGAKIVGQMAVLAEGDAANRDDIIFLEKLPLFDKNGNPLE